MVRYMVQWSNEGCSRIFRIAELPGEFRLADVVCRVELLTYDILEERLTGDMSCLLESKT
jgi:hypothetical protein